jgi:putative membrane protein
MEIPMITRYIACLFGAMAPLMAHAADVSADDRSFVATVSQGGAFEVRVGEIAAQKGTTQDIKDQGTTESHDHKLVGEKLKSIAATNGIEIDGKLNSDFQKEISAWKKLSGFEFDQAYLKDMEAVHAADGAAFAKEAKSGTSPALRDFAAETYRIVERHVGELKATGAKKPDAG